MTPLPRCRTCKGRIAFFGSPFTGKPRAFEPVPVDARTHQGAPAYPVMSGRAYRFTDLVDVIQVQREDSRVAAEDEVRDLPWYVLHECRTTTHESRED